MADVTYTADRAERLLRQYTQASVDPGLTDPEIADLLWAARIADASGYDIDAALWTPTYGVSEIRSAAADGWRLKAMKVTPNFDADVGSGTSFKRKQQFDMCMAMAETFGTSGSAGGLASVGLTTDGWVDVYS
jgi:hypothetical protein